MVDSPPPETSAPRPSSVATAGLRLAVVYFAAYFLNLVPRPLAAFVATRVLGAPPTLALAPTGSGDRAIDWAGALCALVGAVLVTAVWSGLRPRPRRHRRLREWARFGAATLVGSTMVFYGMMKVFPVQMPAPSLVRLLEPLGQFSPMGVLWTFMGVSPGYQVLTGVVEVTGGVLLFWRRTTVLGALVCLVATVQIFALNLAYDVPVKLFSLHLILLVLFLLAPHASRLAAAVVHDPTADAPRIDDAPLRGRAWQLAGRTTLAALVMLMAGTTGYQSWRKVGPTAPHSPLYGVWNVVELTVNGVPVPPLLTSPQRWRRVVFDQPSMMAFQLVDDRIDLRQVAIDATARRIDLLGPGAGTLVFEPPDDAGLRLSGTVDTRTVAMRLERLDHTRLPLLTRPLRWIQERPLNR